MHTPAELIPRRRVLVTGAGGFIGRAVCADLQLMRYDVIGAFSQHNANCESACSRNVSVGRIGESTDWSHVVNSVDCVVHLAARVHVMSDAAVDPLDEFRKVNVKGTLKLARQAADAGVQRFVFISSIKVNGESTQPGCPFAADDLPAPLDPYGVSKMEAEHGLSEIARHSGMGVVIIRPPLVYGPGVKANFAAMMRWLKRGVPLPLGGIYNKRSLVALDNLVDFIRVCLTHPAAANQTFLVSDGEDVSTTELLGRMSSALGRPTRLIAVPARWLELGASIIGKPDMAQRLCSSLQVDLSKTRHLLGWSPPVSLDQGLAKAAWGLANSTKTDAMPT